MSPPTTLPTPDARSLYWIEMEKRAPARERERQHICEIAKRALAKDSARGASGRRRGNTTVVVGRRMDE